MEKHQGHQCLLWFQVPAACEDDAASLPEEWGSLDSQQKELYRLAMKGDYEAVVSFGEDLSLLTSDASSSSSSGLDPA